MEKKTTKKSTSATPKIDNRTKSDNCKTTASASSLKQPSARVASKTQSNLKSSTQSHTDQKPKSTTTTARSKSKIY